MATSFTLKEFATLHGAPRATELAQAGFDFVSIQFGTVYAAFAHNLPQPTTAGEAISMLKSQKWDVLEGTSSEGSVCYTIVEHRDLAPLPSACCSIDDLL